MRLGTKFLLQPLQLEGCTLNRVAHLNTDVLQAGHDQHAEVSEQDDAVHPHGEA